MPYNFVYPPFFFFLIHILLSPPTPFFPRHHPLPRPGPREINICIRICTFELLSRYIPILYHHKEYYPLGFFFFYPLSFFFFFLFLLLLFFRIFPFWHLKVKSTTNRLCRDRDGRKETEKMTLYIFIIIMYLFTNPVYTTTRMQNEFFSYICYHLLGLNVITGRVRPSRRKICLGFLCFHCIYLSLKKKKSRPRDCTLLNNYYHYNNICV